MSSDKRMLYCATDTGGIYICVYTELDCVLVVNAVDSNDVSNWLGYEFIEMVGNLQFN